MRVVIALASASHQISGVPRHAISLARCLLNCSEVTAVHLIAAPWQQQFLHDFTSRYGTRFQLHSASIGESAGSRNLWYCLQLPQLAKELGADIVHLSYPVPLRAGAFHCPTVVTLHDLYPYDIPGNFSFPKVLFNRLIVRQCLSTVDAIACVSESTLCRLCNLVPVSVSEKATVIWNCVEPLSRVSVVSPLPQWLGQPFLLCVAQHRNNKNLPFLVQVFAHLLDASRIPSETRLVLVGMEGPETNAILRTLAITGIEDRVSLLSGISEPELQWCYRNCSLLLAPSLIEGFGLPVIEGLLAGCRVICSDIPAFREVGGDHCRYVPLDSNAEQGFFEAILSSLLEPAPVPIHLPQLSSPVIAEKYLRLYKSLLPPHSSASRPVGASSISTSGRRRTI